MKAQLQSKKVWMVVSGLHSKPASTASNYMDWLEKEEVAAGMIYLALEDDQKVQVETYQDDPRKMWETLESIHIQKRPSTRFNAYNTLLSISKQDQESLPALTARIEKAMAEIKNLRPQFFSLNDLDEDLMSMTMIRALPAEYRSFVSSLILLPQFDFKTLKEAFILEEDNRKASDLTSGVVAAANLTSKTSNQSRTHFSSSSASSNLSPRPVCEFCQIHNHTQAQCRLYKQFQLQARAQALENRQNRRQPHPPANKTSPNASSTKPVVNQAGTVQDSSNVEEFAGNASISLFTSFSPQFSSSLRWCADTGASSHMTPHRAWFHEYEPYSVPIRVADGTVVNSAGIGSIHFLPRLQGVRGREVVFHRVLHVPQLQNNLLSVLYLTSKKGFRVPVEKQTMNFERDGVLLFTASQHGQLAYLDGTTLHPNSALSTTSISLLPLTLDLWHCCFGHMNVNEVKRLSSSNVVCGMRIDSPGHPDPVCEPCIAGKQHRIINRTATRSTVPLEIVHCDLHGPMPVTSIQGHRYFIVFVDDATRLWGLFFLKSKSDAAEAFLTFRAEMEKQTGHTVKCLHDDKEGGLSSNTFNAKLRELGITRRFTMCAEPHSNGVAEMPFAPLLMLQLVCYMNPISLLLSGPKLFQLLSTFTIVFPLQPMVEPHHMN